MNGAGIEELSTMAEEGAGSEGGRRTDALSDREKEVAKLLAQGLTNAQIADQLVLSPRTVHSHVRNAMKATGTTSRTHLAILALRDGLARLHADEGP